MSASRRLAAAPKGTLAVAVAAVAAAALVITYLALGGGSYKPLAVADPCKPRPLPRAEGFEATSQQLLLSALDGAACSLRVSREDLALALASEEERRRFAREHGVDDERLEAAIRAALRRAVADAERAGRLSATQASLVRAAVEALPIQALLELLRSGGALAGAITDLLGR